METNKYVNMNVNFNDTALRYLIKKTLLGTIPMMFFAENRKVRRNLE